MKDKSKLSFCLGSCRIDPSDNSISFQTQGQESAQQESAKVSLQPKFIEVLSYLALRHPHVVTRDELIDKVWEGNAYVGTKALTNAIWHLRQQLSPLELEGGVIETVRKAGYRLLLPPVYDIADETDDDKLQTTEAKLQHTTRRLYWMASLMGAVMLVAGLFMGVHLYQDKQRMTETQITVLTRDPGSERYPRLSHDRRWLVYGASRPGVTSSLYLKDFKREDVPARQLTPSTSAELRAVWSLDDTKLFFASRIHGTGKCHITQLTLATNETLALAPCSSDMAAIDISPDGQYLAYISSHEADKVGGIYRLALANADAKAERLSCESQCNYEDRDLAFSPDGRWLAIARRFSNISEDIFIRDLASANETRLTHGLEDIRGLSWTPDSQSLVFATEDSGSRNGFTIDIETAHIRPLDVEGMSYPSSVSDEGELVYHQYRRQFQMAYFSLGESVPGSLFPLLYSGISHRNPDYSPEAKRIVFVSSDTGYNEIWTSDAKGQKLEQHTQLKSRVAYPRWSPDGSKIAFIAPDDRNEGNRIFILDLTNKNITALASSYHNHGRPSWNWKGTAVLASTSDGITEFHLDNSAPKVISPLSMAVGFAKSANEFVFSRYGMNGLWQIDLTQPEQVQEIIPGKVFRAGNNWVLTAHGVYFKSSNGNEQRLNFWDASNQQLTSLLRVPRSSLSGFGSMTYIPESNRLVMTLDGFPQRDIILLKHKLLK
ncbi:winged helix-turn-helix domain-containing protein [Shewanella seohaensis]|uniref:winged helix-turn-helix domain-containing protein n=1 Tax=Shewanella seohaensis TaxID=755175 RepID=UPI00201002A9|nr:winged helix-turn-helix domain-containing protein [Shewanella seohaensis]MCL1120686.1 winged helix-turn-helix transcriptional regulator [Shewanella seohaensis]